MRRKAIYGIAAFGRSLYQAMKEKRGEAGFLY